MDKKLTSEKVLIIIALSLFAGIIFYNAFYIPDPTISSVVYVDKTQENNSNIQSSLGDDNEENLSSEDESNSASINNSSKININTATQDELDALPGIGKSIANKIIEYREYNGKFNSIDELKGVSGIGEKKFEKIKDLICI